MNHGAIAHRELQQKAFVSKITSALSVMKSWKLQRPFVAMLLLSLFLHVLIGGTMLVVDPKMFTSKPQHRSEVVLLDPAQLQRMFKEQDKLNGQIVDQNEAAVNNERDPNEKYLSRHNQKVIRETRAENHGKFHNAETNAPKTQTAAAREKRQAQAEQKARAGTETRPDNVDAAHERQPEIMTADDGVATKNGKPELKDLMPSFRPAMPKVDAQDASSASSVDPSATDDNLKNVNKGMQTMLSTREFVYFSYYNRIKDKLRQYWEPKIKEKVAHILRSGRSIASTGEKITKIIIVLDDKGILQKVQVVGPSGVSDLDDAAVEAFRAAAPFPNPPHGIIDADGTIKIRWDFVLEANALQFYDGGGHVMPGDGAGPDPTSQVM